MEECMTDKIIWVYANYVVTDSAKRNGGIPAQHKELYQPYIPLSTIETMQKQLDEARDALKRSHACATVKDDGSCEGCFVSEALQKIEKLEE